eukprot:11169734-Lingulodinium_polyedra.AAC.1
MTTRCRARVFTSSSTEAAAKMGCATTPLSLHARQSDQGARDWTMSVQRCVCVVGVGSRNMFGH